MDPIAAGDAREDDHAVEAASWTRRTGQRVGRVRTRALELAPKVPGYEYALQTFKHDHHHGGGLLAGRSAFRLFGALCRSRRR